QLAESAEVPRRIKFRVKRASPGERRKSAAAIPAHHSDRSKIAPELRRAGLGRHYLLVGRLGFVKPAGAHRGFCLPSKVARSASLPCVGWNSPKACLHKQTDERYERPEACLRPLVARASCPHPSRLMKNAPKCHAEPHSLRSQFDFAHCP